MSATVQPTSSTPSALEAFNLVIRAALAEVHTAMPGTIHSFDASTQTASVRLGLRRKYQSETTATDYPIVTQVPVVFPSVAGGFLRLPVAAGDTGLVIFGERALDNWLEVGGSQDPELGRRFSIADAVFVPGLVTKGKQVRPAGDPSSIELSCGGTRVELTKAGKVRVTNGAVDLLGVLDSLLTHLQTLGTVGSASAQVVNPATIANLAADQLQLRSLMP